MKKFLSYFALSAITLLTLPTSAFAAGISVSNTGAKYVGDTTTVTITASGATFNAFSGTISASGPIKIVSTSPGDALWVTKPSGTGDFVGAVTNSVTSFRIATLKVQGTGVGTGKISVSGVKLANKGAVAGNDGGSTSFSFERKPVPPGSITVSSATHPDQKTFYEATSATLTWDKPSGVTGFSYLMNDAADTVPEAKITSADLTMVYDGLTIGTHYFHIRAINGDGWGPASHFTINIKEPDPKIKDALTKPSNISVRKASTFINDPLNGTFSGIVISGTTEPNFTANFTLSPLITLPEGKVLSILSDASGNFEYTIDFPIKAGFYTLTVQGQDMKTLTPVSDPLVFEISQAKGGKITMLTKDDELGPIIPPLKWYEKIEWMMVSYTALAVALIAIGFLVTLWIKIKKHRKDNN
ncbi:MAG: fibronectin type III domain-containing protein [Candidatus Berkelbacteria bacterium]